MIVYFKGQFIPFEEAVLPLNDRGILLGDGLFEVMLANHGFVECYHAHYRRFESAALILKLPPPMKRTHALKIIDRLLAENNLLDQKAAVRLTLTRGETVDNCHFTDNIEPTFFAQAWPYVPRTDPIRALISTYRLAPNSLSHVNHLGHLLPIIAFQEAKMYGVDEAILLNTASHVACASASNIFIIKDDKIITPPLSDGGFAGILRGVLLKLARREQLPIHVKSISEEELKTAEMIFLTNSLIELQKVSHLGRKCLATHHPLFEALERIYRQFREKERNDMKMQLLAHDLPTNYTLRIQD